jgi:tRNA(Ile)-lysidine synthase
VSGGADSTALLAALSVLIPVNDLFCLHVEHGIRPPEESRGDALFVVDLCKQLGMRCRVVSIKPGRIAEYARERRIGIEAAARMFRHKIWNQQAVRIKAARILVAHTQDDLLELILMRFLRGSGPAGLAALPRESGHVLRPLLSLSRSDVLAYLAGRGIAFRVDSTNADIHYLRNRVRHVLIPYLNEQFPYWKKPVYALAQTQRFVARFLSTEAYNNILWQKVGQGLYTDANNFFSQNEILREESLFYATDMILSYIKKQEHGMPDPVKRSKDTPRRDSIRLFTQRIATALDAGPVRIVQQGEAIVVSPVQPAYEDGFSLLIKTPGIYILLERLQIECTFNCFYKGAAPAFSADLPIVIRSSGRTGVFYGENSQGRAAKIVCTNDTVTVVPYQKVVGTAFFFITRSNNV